MVRVYFKLDMNKDMKNWYEACNSSFMGVDWKSRISPDLRNKIAGVKKEKAMKFLRAYLNEKYKDDGKLIHKTMGTARTYWGKNGVEVFRRLKKITGHPIWPSKIYCYYTTFPRGPYYMKKDFAWLLVPSGHSTDKLRYSSTILHEALHFQFHRYFWAYCKKCGLSFSRIDNIKEALTFLINEEFSDLVAEDRGYKVHKRFRRDLKMIWRKDKNFERLLDKAIVLIKGKYSYLARD
jgi:hypothetical protein